MNGEHEHANVDVMEMDRGKGEGRFGIVDVKREVGGSIT